MGFLKNVFKPKVGGTKVGNFLRKALPFVGTAVLGPVGGFAGGIISAGTTPKKTASNSRISARELYKTKQSFVMSEETTFEKVLQFAKKYWYIGAGVGAVVLLKDRLFTSGRRTKRRRR